MKPTKVTIPEELKANLPPTRFGKLLGATPVVMAVVATMLAGLASSEMTRAQYDRSTGAQLQSKAGDQWSFFQAKRLRGAIQRNTADLLQTVVDVPAFDPTALARAVQQMPAPAPGQEGTPDWKTQTQALLQSPAGQQALEWFRKGELPTPDKTASPEPRIQAAMAGVETSVPDSEMRAMLAKLENASLESALKTARNEAERFDSLTKPVNQAIDRLDALLTQQLSAQGEPAGAAAVGSRANPWRLLNRQFTAARLRTAALRYEIEARLNQTIANLYELQVRKSNYSAEHHQKRSQRFFFGMLAAQAGVIISTFAMAARNRSLLWSLAAGAGVLAVAFAIYVYLYV